MISVTDEDALWLTIMGLSPAHQDAVDLEWRRRGIPPLSSPKFTTAHLDEVRSIIVSTSASGAAAPSAPSGCAAPDGGVARADGSTTAMGTTTGTPPLPNERGNQ